MFVIVNQVTDAVLTYRDGGRILCCRHVDAQDKATLAQRETMQPHKVLNWPPVFDSTRREVAPWLRHHSS